MYEQKDVRKSYLYDEVQILMVWNAHVRKELNCHFFCGQVHQATDGFVDTLLHFGQNNISLDGRGAGIVVSVNKRLYKTPNNQSVTVCGYVNYRQNLHGNVDDITVNLEKALNQIVKWNNTYPTDQITSHLIIFPYQSSPNHWTLGKLELTHFNSLNASITIYDPFGGGHLSSDTSVFAKVENVIKQVFAQTAARLIQTNNDKHSRQQFDSTSCGAITAENGKYFIGQNPSSFPMIYHDATELRRSHLNQVNVEHFCNRQWSKQCGENETKGDISFKDEDQKIKEIKEHIDKTLSKEEATKVKMMFNTLYNLNKEAINNSDFIQHLERLSEKERNNADLSEVDKKHIAKFFPDRKYTKNRINTLLVNPYRLVFDAIKDWFLQQKIKGLQYGDLFDKEGKFKSGTRSFLDKLGEIFSNSRESKNEKELKNVDKNKLKLLSYYAFSILFIECGCHSIHKLQYEESQKKFTIIAQNEHNIIQLREKIIHELKDTNTGLGSFIKDHENYQKTVDALDKSTISRNNNQCTYSINQDIFDILIRAIDEYDKLNKNNSKPANSTQTGSAGAHFEEKIQAYFFILMITNSVAPVIASNDYSWLCLQAGPQGFKTDDLVLCFNEGTPIERKLLCQVKRRLDNDFEKALTLAWEDFTGKIFNANKDHIAFATTPFLELTHFKRVVELAKFSPSTAHFFNSLVDDTLTNSYKKIEEIICKIESKSKHDPEINQRIFEFIKVLSFIEFTYDTTMNLDEAHILTLIQKYINCNTQRAKLIWSSIYMTIGKYNENGGKILKGKIPQEIKELFSESIIDYWQNDIFPTVGDYFIGRKAEIQQIEEKLFTTEMKANITTKRKLLALRGDGGVGKTFLALQAIYKNKAQADHIKYCLFFNAEKIEELEQQYADLAKEIGIPVEHLHSSSSINKKITHWLQNNTGWIILYDNAKNKRQLGSFLPSHGGYIIVTTRSKSFTPNEILIGKMLEEDAILLLETEINKEVETSRQELTNLANKLDRIPLALTQAARYIGKHKVDINEYISRYDKTRDEILRYSGLEDRDPSHICVFSTWDISIEEIRKIPHAEDILIICSYLSSTQIPRELLSAFITQSKSNTLAPGQIPNMLIDSFTPENISSESLLAELENYSMIRQHQGNVSIHRILQDVIITKQKLDKKDLIWRTNIIAILAEQFKYDRDVQVQLDYAKKLIPHVDKLLDTTNDIVTNESANLLHHSGVYYLDIRGKPERALIYLERAFKIFSQLDKNKSKSALHRQLHKCYLQLGKMNQAEEHLVEALPENEEDYTVNDCCDRANFLLSLKPTINYPKIEGSGTATIEDKDSIQTNQILAKRYFDLALKKAKNAYDAKQNDRTLFKQQAMVLHYLGNYHLKLRQYDMALNYYNDSIKIKELHYNALHFEIGRTLHQIGCCYFLLKDYANASKNLRQAYEIRKNHYDGKELLSTIKYLSSSLIRQDNFDESKKYLDLRLSFEQKLMLSVDTTFYLLAQVSLKLGCRTEASEYLDKCKRKSRNIASLRSILTSANIDDLIPFEKIDLDDLDDIDHAMMNDIPPAIEDNEAVQSNSTSFLAHHVTLKHEDRPKVDDSMDLGETDETPNSTENDEQAMQLLTAFPFNSTLNNRAPSNDNSLDSMAQVEGQPKAKKQKITASSPSTGSLESKDNSSFKNSHALNQFGKFSQTKLTFVKAVGDKRKASDEDISADENTTSENNPNKRRK